MSKAIQKANAQLKSNVIYANFKKNKPLSANGIYNKNYDRWKNILRADGSGKKIAAECLFYIAAIEFLFLKNPNKVIFDSTLLKKKSNHKQKQRGRFLKQLADLYNIKYHHSYIYEGEQVYGKFVCTRTQNSQKLLEDPTKFYEEKCLQNDFSYSQKRPHLQSNLTVPIYIVDKVEKEEDPLGLSSSFSSLCSLSPQEGKTDFVVTENTDRTTTMQSEEMPMPYPKEGGISHPATNMLEESYLTAEQEKEHYSKQRNTDSSSNQPISLLQVLDTMKDIPIAANQNDEGTSMHHGQQEDTPSPVIVNQDTRTREEAVVNTDKPIQLRQEIFKSFNPRTSEGIMENCTFTELEPNKLGISIQAEFSLNMEDKEKLKTCIRAVYGDDVKMVSTSSQNKQEVPQAQSQEAPIRYVKTEWDSMKEKIAKYFPENQYNHVIGTWLDHLNCSYSNEEKVVVIGRAFYVDYITDRFASAIEQAVAQTRKSLVLQYEGNAQRPIEFKFKR